MARRNYNFVILIVVIVAAVVMLTGTRAATTYYVGDTIGWMVPSGGAATYASWAAQHAFITGDVLVFNFTTGRHSAAKVTSNDFGSCNVNNPISLQTTGPASYTLDSSPQQFFICTFSNHCSVGQKLQINLTSSSTTPPPGSSPKAAAPPPPPPSPPPPQSSASRAAAATFSLIFLYTVMTNLLW